MKYIILLLIFVGCAEQEFPDLGLNKLKRPIIVVAKNNFTEIGWNTMPQVTLRDSVNRVLVIVGNDAVQFIQNYKVGDTLK